MRDCSNDKSSARPPQQKPSLRGRRPVELKVDALSQGEWNYILGVFLADGRARLGLSHVKKRNKVYPHYEVNFYLQGNEAELARRVQWLLGRAGLKSRLNEDPRKEMLVVSVFSKSLFNFLPRAEILKRDTQARSRFFEEHDMLTAKCGVPFLAGLIDGDGCCFGCVRVKRNGLQYVESSCRFSQTKFPFLIDYIKTLIGTVLAPGKRVVSIYLDPHKGSYSQKPLRVLSILRAGVDTLVTAGIEKFSWKIPRWLRLLESLRAWRRLYLTTPEAARLLRVNISTIRNWIRVGKLSRVMRRGRWNYIEADEIEELRTQPEDRGS